MVSKLPCRIGIDGFFDGQFALIEERRHASSGKNEHPRGKEKNKSGFSRKEFREGGGEKRRGEEETTYRLSCSLKL